MVKLRKSSLQIQSTLDLIGPIYPVLIDDETGEILDGRERTKIDEKWPQRKFHVPGSTTEEKELNRLRIKHISNWSRKTPDHKKDLTEIADRTGWRGLKPFAGFLGVSEQTISKYLPQKYKDKIKANARKGKSAQSALTQKVENAFKIFEDIQKEVEIAPLADEKREEIRSSIETTQNLLSSMIISLPKKPISIDDELNSWLDEIGWEYSLWDCQYERPEGYGDKTFHGNCSPSIIVALLKRFSTTEDNLILDPMVGSGTFIDTALAMGYSRNQIIGRDIKPMREDVEYGDAINTELSDESVDFVFAHFPYWKLIKYTVDSKLDASGFSYESFLEWSEKVFIEIKRVLKRKRYFAVMIGNLRKQGIVDLESTFSEMGRRHFKLWDKIIKKIRTWDPETRGQRMGLALSRARQHGYTVVNHDTILVFRKG